MDSKLKLKPPEASELPKKVIIIILKFLPYSDRKCASLVNRSWLNASLDSYFVEKETVVLNCVTLEDNASPLSVIRKSLRPYLNFVFIDSEIGTKTFSFWEEKGAEIQSVVFTRCDIVEKHFAKILMSCPNLKSLELECCSELLMSGRLFDDALTLKALSCMLTKVKNLKITDNRYLSDALLSRFINIAPNIELLSLAKCPISFYPRIYETFYGNQPEGAEVSSENVLTFHIIRKCMIKRAKRIKSLDFTCTLIDSTALTEVAILPELDLESIYLAACDKLSDSGILALTHHQKNLQVLDLSSCPGVTDAALINICDSLILLSELSVRNCQAITDLGVANFWKLTSLGKLDISECKSVTSSGFQSGLCHMKNITLESLKLASLSLIDDRTIVELSTSAPNLVHLDLSHCSNAVTDLSLQAICQHLLLLRVLKIAGCDKVSDVGFVGMNAETLCRTSELESCDGNPLQIPLRRIVENEGLEDAKCAKTVKKMCCLQLIEANYSLARIRGMHPRLIMRG